MGQDHDALTIDLCQDLQGVLSDAQAAPIRGAVLRIEAPRAGFVFEGAVGEARPDTRAPMTPETPFHVASVAKTTTAALILMLLEEGRFGALGLDTRLADLGVFDDAVIARLHAHQGTVYGQNLTLRHLLTHTSGMKDAMVDDAGATASEAGGLAPGSLLGRQFMGDGDPARDWIGWDRERPFDRDAGVLNYYLNADGMAQSALFPPGGGFHYSDTAYVVLAVVVETLFARPLHVVLRERIVEPLGLAPFYYAYREDPPLGPARAPEADVHFGPMPMLTSGANLSFDWGGGGLVASAGALCGLLRGLAEGQVFAHPATYALMTDWRAPSGLVAPRTGVGHGLFRLAYPGGTLVGHSGAFGAKMFYDPELQLYCAGTINQGQANGSWFMPFLAKARVALFGR